MCNSQTQQFIDQVVREKISSNTMFTLFDITLGVQDLQTAQALPITKHRHIHDDVEQAASQAFAAGWLRLFRPMGDGKSANVYFNPAVHDVNNYTPLPRQNNSPSIPTPLHVAIPGVHPAALAFANDATNVTNTKDTGVAVTKDTIRKSLDRWGRLRLPAALIQQVGFQPGHVAFVSGQNGKLTIGKISKGLVISKYIVDSHCNIRLTPKTLKAAGFSSNSCTLTASTDSIIVN